MVISTCSTLLDQVLRASPPNPKFTPLHSFHGYLTIFIVIMKSSSESDAESSPFLGEEQELGKNKLQRPLPESQTPTQTARAKFISWAQSHSWALNLLFLVFNLALLTTTAIVGWQYPASSRTSCPSNEPWCKSPGPLIMPAHSTQHRSYPTNLVVP